ncbi:MAG: saccharopine dehydrogenase NADP-binding domain-containing protein, partial [Chloroflexales bacterium]|nr:saccharopine dehydrogenase NADP-binding domain-containing protein [Chloroflexales bacterium]
MATMMIYGASGYTGALIARAAVRQGLRPILAGRSADKLAPLASELGLTTRAFDLQNPAVVEGQLGGIAVLLNAGGPFKRTAQPLAAACLRTGTHYLDLAGEVPEFEALLARDQEAQAAGVLLMPGVGFGVVPTDCLAVYLKGQLPSATTLTLAFETVGGVSPGTAETVIEDLPGGGVARRDGRLVRVPAGLHRRQIDFGRGPVATLSNPWRGDLSTA